MFVLRLDSYKVCADPGLCPAAPGSPGSHPVHSRAVRQDDRVPVWGSHGTAHKRGRATAGARGTQDGRDVDSYSQ